MKNIYEGQIIYIDDQIKCDFVAVLYNNKEYIVKELFFMVQQFIEHKKTGLLDLMQRISIKESKINERQTEMEFTNYKDVEYSIKEKYLYVCYYKYVRVEQNHLLDTIEMIEMGLDKTINTRELVMKENYCVKSPIRRIIEHFNESDYFIKIYYEPQFEPKNIYLYVNNMKSWLFTKKKGNDFIAAQFYIENLDNTITFTLLQDNFCYNIVSSLKLPKTYKLFYWFDFNHLCIEVSKDSRITLDIFLQNLTVDECHEIKLSSEDRHKTTYIELPKTNVSLLMKLYIDNYCLYIVNTEYVFGILL